LKKPLRKGVTTGLCAAGAAKAATIALLSSQSVAKVEVFARTGEKITLAITETTRSDDSVRCGVVKDAGDDYDVTHGMTVYATVSKTSQPGVAIDGGEGIGRVTKPGLKAEVGQAAINPVPRAMITATVQEASDEYGYEGGILVVISIPGGEEVARRTLNERLGVIGGLSILGTTGIVEPMSERALLDTIYTELDVLCATRAANQGSILIMPGNYGRDFARDELGFDTDSAVRCSNFIGETFAYALDKGVSSITFVGHAGKLVKLAGGIMNTHSRYGDCRMEIISAHSALAGADQTLVEQLMQCVTTEAAIDLLQAARINDIVWESIAGRIAFYLSHVTEGCIDIEFYVFTQEHGVLAKQQVWSKARQTV